MVRLSLFSNCINAHSSLPLPAVILTGRAWPALLVARFLPSCVRSGGGLLLAGFVRSLCRCALCVPVFAWAAPFALVAASVVRLGLLSSALAFWGLRVVFRFVFVPPFSVPCAFLVHML